MEARTCKTCRYWVKDKAYTYLGDCHRNPPIAQPGYQAIFPSVDEAQWCGEWMLFKGKAK